MVEWGVARLESCITKMLAVGRARVKRVDYRVAWRSVGRFVKRTLLLGALAGVSYAVWRALAARQSEATFEWEAQPFPYPPTPAVPGGEPASPDEEAAAPDEEAAAPAPSVELDRLRGEDPGLGS